MYAFLKPGLNKGIQLFTYPVLVLVGLALHFSLANMGVNNFFASTIPVFICLGGISLLEMNFPYRREWQANITDYKTDLSFLVLVQGIAPKFLGLVVSLLWAQNGFNSETLDGIWPKNWSILGQSILMILLADLLRYWLHVAAHRLPLLWKFHAIHHQPKKLYSVNVVRFHPAEKAMQFLFDTLPFILLGVSAEVIACYFVFYAINGFIQHSNIELKFGFLNYIISTSELHRWHHNEDLALSNCNFGNNLIIWDLLFGSYYLPKEKTVGRVGIKGVEPTGFLDALKQPFIGQFNLTRLKQAIANLAIKLMYQIAKIKYWRPFEQQCDDPETTQDQLLKTIITKQSGTNFGKNHDFDAIHSYSGYKSHINVQSYEDLRPLFEKQAMQGSPEMTAEDPILYAQTSGSTGKPKYIPVTTQSLTDLKKTQTLSSLMMHEACPEAFAGKMLGIVSPVEEGFNEWGKLCGSASGLIMKNMPELTKKKQLLPLEVFAVEDYDLKYDLIALSALAEENITFIGTANPSTLLLLMNRLNSKRDFFLELLSDDKPMPGGKFANPVAQSILANINCSETRLNFLSKLYATKQAINFADLWPNLRLIITWTGGSCGIPLDALSKGLPASCKIMELGYVASEFRGTITHSSSQLGIPTLHENFFEFVEKNNWESGIYEFLRLHEIEPNEKYYIFVTNLNGLYRYDMNDIVQVSGYFKNTPCLRFIQKGKGTTSITGEKLYEAQLFDATNTLSRQHDIQPVFYLCIANELDSKYELFLETSGNVDLSEKEISTIVDRSLAASNIEYQSKRASHRLKSIEVNLLNPGTAEIYKKEMVNKGQRECQFKVMTLQYARDNSFPFEQHRIN